MKINLIGRLFGGVVMFLGSSAAVVTGLYKFNPSIFDRFYDVDIYAISLKNQSKNPTNNAESQKEKNIKCKLSTPNNSHDTNCVIKSSKSKNIQTKKYVATSSFDDDINEISSIQDNQYYKITINKIFLSHLNKTTTKTIEIYKDQKSWTLQALFSFENRTITEIQPYKKYFIGTAAKIDDSSPIEEISKSADADKNYSCNILLIFNYDCKIYDFSNSETKNITSLEKIKTNFNKTTQVKEKIKNDHFYLIENKPSNDDYMWTLEMFLFNNFNITVEEYNKKNHNMNIINTHSAVLSNEILFIFW